MKGVDESIPQNALIPQTATLEDLCAQEGMNGVQVDELKESDTLVVETEHHTYEITVTNPSSAEVLIRGGELFPVQTPAWILGSSKHRTFLKLRGIYAGFAVELLSGGKRIITSRVRRITCNDSTGKSRSGSLQNTGATTVFSS
jgi:hypothetical protein